MLIRSNPSYVSVWRPMTANSEHSRLTLRHDLNEDPAYVKVEGRTDTGFIFPAFGSSQQDDDTGTLYGGRYICLTYQQQQPEKELDSNIYR